MRPRATVCPTCKIAPREVANGYCRPCNKLRDRGWKARKRATARKLIEPSEPESNLCSCRDPGCNGMRCDSFRYGTAKLASEMPAHQHMERR